MIKVTLEFENEAALVSYFKDHHPDVKEAIAAARVDTVALAVEKATKAKAAKVEAPKPVPTPTAPETATPPQEEVAVATPAAESPSEVNYEAVYAAITAKAATDKPKVVAALAKFGAKRGPELKAEDYAAFLKELA